MKRLSLVLCVVMLSGCAVPQWRVFQKSVPAPVGKSEAQVESERQAADLIAKTVEEPVQLRPVAQTLSESLGKPLKPLDHTNIPTASNRAVSGLESGILEVQRERAKQDEFLARYEGLQIENTGVNLFGGSVVLSMVAVVALCVLVPGFGTLVLFLIRRLRVGLQQTVEGIAQFSEDEPESAQRLKNHLRGRMDSGSKAVVNGFRRNLSKPVQDNIQEIKKSKDQ